MGPARANGFEHRSVPFRRWSELDIDGRGRRADGRRCPYVGIATTSHNTAATTQAVVDSSTVTTAAPAPPPQNQSPTVALTAPANGASYTAPASVALTASAADSDGSIARVEFYAGDDPPQLGCERAVQLHLVVSAGRDVVLPR